MTSRMMVHDFDNLHDEDAKKCSLNAADNSIAQNKLDMQQTLIYGVKGTASIAVEIMWNDA